jgi:hypothetical protein
MNFMFKNIATIVLMVLVGMMFCGFIATGQTNHAISHTGSDSAEHHFTLWTEISVALISDAAIALASLISVLVVLSLLFVLGSNELFLHTKLAFERTERDPHRHPADRLKKISWLSLLEHSPSHS